MAGHSKWKQIKHKKALLDSRRGKSFTKLIKEITVAAKIGGGDPSGNPRLRTLLEKAKEINMPADNAARAIKKGTGELPGVSYEQFIYEGYGPNGIAVLVETLSDNKNRTVGELRHSFSVGGGNLGETGSVNWMFEKVASIETNANNFNEDSLLEKLLDYDISEITLDEGTFFITCNPKSLEQVKQALLDLGFKVEKAEIEWSAKNTVKLEPDQAEKVVEFLQTIEDLEDVQNVYANLE